MESVKYMKFFAIFFCLDTVGWVTWRASGLCKLLLQLDYCHGR